MTEEVIEFMIKLSNKIMEINELFRRDDWSCIITESTNWKEYYTVNFKFEYWNSKYEDCIIFYHWDSFNEGEFWEEFDIIIEKAKKLKE